MKIIITVVSIVIYIFCVLFALAWAYSQRDKVRRTGYTEKATEIFTLFMFISLVLVPVLHLSPFHLVWMFPVSFLLGFLGILPPFSLILMPLASMLEAVLYIGIKPPELK